jgi:hypothetical protein
VYPNHIRTHLPTGSWRYPTQSDGKRGMLMYASPTGPQHKSTYTLRLCSKCYTGEGSTWICVEVHRGKHTLTSTSFHTRHVFWGGRWDAVMDMVRMHRLMTPEAKMSIFLPRGYSPRKFQPGHPMPPQVIKARRAHGILSCQEACDQCRILGCLKCPGSGSRDTHTPTSHGPRKYHSA